MSLRPSKYSIGQKFEQITISSLPAGKAKIYGYTCSCGKIGSIREERVGKTKSCGCANRIKATVEGAKKSIYSSYKTSAKRRKLSFNISFDVFSSLIDQKCSYCEEGPSNSKLYKKLVFNYNGLDCLDNTVGYEESNVVTCCKKCNYLKSTIDYISFLEIIHKIKSVNTVKVGIKEAKLSGYHARALAVAKNSHDAQTKVGAILIDEKSGAVFAEGFNGFVRGADDNKLPNTRPEKYKYIIHAEKNLVCNSVRHGIKMSGCVVYCTLSPCVDCARMLYQCGINTIYFKEAYTDLNNSINMGDLDISVEPVNDFFKMSISPKIK